MQDATTDRWTDELLSTLERQQTLADQLAALAHQQQQLIEAHRTDELLQLLAQRQEVVNAFISVQETFATMTTELDRRLATMDGASRNRVRARIDQISQQLAVVMQADERDQQRLQSARSDVVQQFEKLGVNRQANSAYRVATGDGPRYTDRKG